VYRLREASAAVRAAVPDSVVPAFEAVTALGSAQVAVVVLAVGYWLGRRRATAAVVAYSFATVAVVLVAKHALGLPRPPATLWVVPADGYGVPSGHAAAGAVVYGGLAAEYGWRLEDAPWRLVGTVALVALVAVSRVVLGVHYLGDALAGVGVGLAVLGGCRVLTGGDPVRAFLVATVAAVPAVIVAGATPETVGVLGATLAGAATLAVVDVPRLESHRERVALVGVGGAGIVGLALLGGPVATTLVGAIARQAVLVAGILLLPVAVDHVDADTVGLRSAGDG
jgi:hypothetical protein